MAKKNEKPRISGQIPMMENATDTGKLYEDTITSWKGLNLRDSLDTGELSSTSNMSSDALPYLVPMLSRSQYKTGITNPQGMYATEGALLWVAVSSGSDKLYYDNGTTVTSYVLKSHTTDIVRSMVEFNGVVLIFPDKKYFDCTELTIGDIGSGTYPDDPGSCPDIDYATVYNNRVFGAKGDDIYCTALGLYDDWTTFDGTSEEADAIDVASKGDFKGIASYSNHIVAFKPEFMHQQYGVKPPFRLQDLYNIGTIDNRSIKEVNNRLYFADDKNVYMYAGGEPRPISINLNKTFTEARAGSDNRKYYLSAYDGTSWNLFVYDTYTSVWMREDGLQVVDFAYWKKRLYALTSTGYIYKFNVGTDPISWEFVTDMSTLKNIKGKYVNEIRMRFELGLYSNMTVRIKHDNGSWMTIKDYIDNRDINLKTLTIPINPKEADRFQIKIDGHGYAKIYQIVQQIRGGD